MPVSPQQRSVVHDPESRCAICQLHLAHAGDRTPAWKGWMLRAHPSPSPIAGWMIIDLRRHAESWGDLSVEECQEIGVRLREASVAIQQVTGCARVYVLSFAEVVRHVHIHLVPRHGDDPRSAGWSVADHYRAVANGVVPAADAAACDEASARIFAALASMRM